MLLGLVQEDRAFGVHMSTVTSQFPTLCRPIRRSGGFDPFTKNLYPNTNREGLEGIGEGRRAGDLLRRARLHFQSPLVVLTQVGIVFN